MSASFVLVSHALCPYVQRAAIVLHEKGVAFERRDVDLANKPDWFLRISPLGKTPVLLVNQTPIFESAVICEYLDETLAPPLHPADPIERALHRGWIEMASAALNAIAALYGATDSQRFDAARAVLRERLERIDAALGPGPWFAGAHFSIVDAAFAPVFRYFDVFASLGEPDPARGLPRLAAWRTALAQRPSVGSAVALGYPRRLEAFLRGRRSELSRRIGSRLPERAPMV
ncbi:MAG: glutathione S-transferase family protein [Reyranellaceae bacterium]